MNSLTAGLHKVGFRRRTGAIFAISLAMLLFGVITRRAVAYDHILQGYITPRVPLRMALALSGAYSRRQTDSFG
jgi:hypothetical protein